MANETTFVIDLGMEAELIELYSWPNIKGSKESLKSTILHWFNQTLKNDGYCGDKAATASIVVKSKFYALHLTGPKSLKGYQDHLPKFLNHGRAALKRIVEIQAEDAKRAEKAKAKGAKPPKKHWDPRGVGDWRFFLPLGLPLINQRSVQFFHYPPIRLLETNRDYLDDPVPKRWEELLVANGIKPENVALYEAVMDSVPVGASDEEGSAKGGGMPINDFVDYQKSQVELLLGEPNSDGFTMPIVVYGANPRKRFWMSYKKGFPESVQTANTWGIKDPQRVQIRDGCTTSVLAMNHPYSFFMDIQSKKGDDFIPGVTGFWQAGAGKMLESLVAARWQKQMAATPSQDPIAVYKDCQAYWGTLDDKYVPAAKPQQREAAAALILHQGSLDAGVTGTWKFVRDLETSQKIVTEFKQTGAVQQESLLPAEKASMINDMLKFLCAKPS